MSECLPREHGVDRDADADEHYHAGFKIVHYLLGCSLRFGDHTWSRYFLRVSTHTGRWNSGRDVVFFGDISRRARAVVAAALGLC